MSKHKPSAVRFFFSHAGYSYDPATETKIQGRWKTARDLAEAEKRGKDAGLVFEWMDKQDVDISWVDDEQLKEYHDGHIEMLECSCWQGNTVLASLGSISIMIGDRSYRRVVEAELAAEALDSSDFQDPTDIDTPQ